MDINNHDKYFYSAIVILNGWGKKQLDIVSNLKIYVSQYTVSDNNRILIFLREKASIQ